MNDPQQPIGNSSQGSDVFNTLADVAGKGPLGSLLRAAAQSTGPHLAPDELPIGEGGLVPVPTPQGAVPMVGMRAAPPQFSVNDVHKLREQDQAIAQLAVQHAEMATGPWKYEALTEIPEVPKLNTRVGYYSNILSAMMTPVSAAGSQRGTSAKQTMYFMNVGANKITAASETACKGIHQRLNEEYFKLIADRKAQVIAALVAATKPGPPLPGGTFHCAKCGQTRVAFDSQEAAEGMTEKLNVSYLTIVQPEIDRVLQEIREEAAKCTQP